MLLYYAKDCLGKAGLGIALTKPMLSRTVFANASADSLR